MRAAAVCAVQRLARASRRVACVSSCVWECVGRAERRGRASRWWRDPTGVGASCLQRAPSEGQRQLRSSRHDAQASHTDTASPSRDTMRLNTEFMCSAMNTIIMCRIRLHGAGRGHGLLAGLHLPPTQELEAGSRACNRTNPELQVFV